MRIASLAVLLALGSGTQSNSQPYHLIPGAVPLDSGPDGNTIALDAPKGLIVFDTGRHPEHAQAILDYAKARQRPIAAIVNSHWHLDHTTGNWEIRQAYPRVDVYASNALEGALATFLKTSRADFATWRTAYDNFVKCGQSSADKKTCVDGWSRDAARFIDAEHQGYARGAADYYLETRLRSSPAEQARYCKPLGA